MHQNLNLANVANSIFLSNRQHLKKATTSHQSALSRKVLSGKSVTQYKAAVTFLNSALQKGRLIKKVFPPDITAYRRAWYLKKESPSFTKHRQRRWLRKLLNTRKQPVNHHFKKRSIIRRLYHMRTTSRRRKATRRRKLGWRKYYRRVSPRRRMLRHSKVSPILPRRDWLKRKNKRVYEARQLPRSSTKTTNTRKRYSRRSLRQFAFRFRPPTTRFRRKQRGLATCLVRPRYNYGDDQLSLDPVVRPYGFEVSFIAVKNNFWASVANPTTGEVAQLVSAGHFEGTKGSRRGTPFAAAATATWAAKKLVAQLERDGQQQLQTLATTVDQLEDFKNYKSFISARRRRSALAFGNLFSPVKKARISDRYRKPKLPDNANRYQIRLWKAEMKRYHKLQLRLLKPAVDNDDDELDPQDYLTQLLTVRLKNWSRQSRWRFALRTFYRALRGYQLLTKLRVQQKVYPRYSHNGLRPAKTRRV